MPLMEFVRSLIGGGDLMQAGSDALNTAAPGLMEQATGVMDQVSGLAAEGLPGVGEVVNDLAAGGVDQVIDQVLGGR